MKEFFGRMANAEECFLYTISQGGLTACVTDCGAALVRLLVPDSKGAVSDVVLGFDSCEGYLRFGGYLGATVGRNANRIRGAQFTLNGKTVKLDANEGPNNLHSGVDGFNRRRWDVVLHTEDTIALELSSPHGDQGFPGNARIRVTYRLDGEGGLHILYDGICDQDTVFNLTNHSYFNLAGHDHPEKAMAQLLSLPGRFFTPADAESIPTGEQRGVEGTPMDFRTPKPIGRDIEADYAPLHLQGGYDHNWEVFCNPCAQLSDPESGRTMSVSTDLPGIQFYAGNFLSAEGKGGVRYGKRSGIALETQFYPDAVHHPEWPQPITKAGEHYRSETVYRFTW